MTRSHRFALALVYLVAAGACEKKKETATSPPPAPAPAPAPGSSPAAATKPPAPPTVKLLEPGSEPRKPLRFHPAAGSKESALMTMNMGMEMTMGTNRMPKTDMPPMKISFDVEVKNVASNGEITYEFRVSKAEAVAEGPSAQMATMLNASLGKFVGLGGSARISDRGFSRGLELKMPEGVDAQVKAFLDNMQQSMSQLAAPVPEEPIGVGAKWQVDMDLILNGIAAKQTTVYELVAREGDKAKLRATVTQKGEQQPVSPPGMPAGMSARLKSLASSGSGDVELTMTHIFPSAKMSMTTETSMQITSQGQQQDMDTKLTADVMIEPK